MKKFHVGVREVHVQTVEVEAENAEEAREKVQEGEGDYLDNMLEYSHCLDSDLWTVEEVPSESQEPPMAILLPCPMCGNDVRSLTECNLCGQEMCPSCNGDHDCSGLNL